MRSPLQVKHINDSIFIKDLSKWLTSVTSI